MTPDPLTPFDLGQAVSLKKSKHDLEAKIQEQEDELDDQAGQIQQLEQVRERGGMKEEREREGGG